MDDRFKEDQELVAIRTQSGQTIRIDLNGVEKITVVMEPGQMALVPWFAIWKNRKIIEKYNAALVEGVRLE